jgi:uncharacterized protein YlxP (DUF503 family)
MIVGVCRLSLMLPESHSLKEKRTVLRSLKDRVRQKFNVAIAEVADTDVWQSAVVGLAVVANDRRFVEAMVEKIVAFVDGEVKIADEEKDFIQYGEEPITSEVAHWEPEEDSPVSRAAGRKPRAPKPRDETPFPWEEGRPEPEDD